MTTATIVRTALTVAHSGSGIGEPTWARLTPAAAPTIEAAAYALADYDVKVTFWDPQSEALRPSDAGKVQAHRLIEGRIKHLASTSASVSDMGRATTRHKDTSTTMMNLPAGDDVVAEALLSAAVLLSSGRDVLLWTDGSDLRILDLGH